MGHSDPCRRRRPHLTVQPSLQYRWIIFSFWHNYLSTARSFIKSSNSHQRMATHHFDNLSPFDLRKRLLNQQFFFPQRAFQYAGTPINVNFKNKIVLYKPFKIPKCYTSICVLRAHHVRISHGISAVKRGDFTTIQPQTRLLQATVRSSWATGNKSKLNI